MSTTSELWIAAAKGRIYGRASGNDSSPLVLGLHGWSQRNGWATWEALLAPLADGGYFAVSVDMPGWGRSAPWSPEPMSLEEGAEVVLNILEALGKRSAALMGKSWGGAVALQAALAYPEKVSKLILSAPAFQQIERLKEVRQPTLLVWAEDDPVIPVSYAQIFRDALPNAVLVRYAQGGHSAGPKNASDLAPRAVAFLRKDGIKALEKGQGRA
jgi:pimeloyl-ACP methyl ester carboxylesterase